MKSSYEKNNYGMIFRSLLLAKQPKSVVECGILDGYSTFHIAHALRFNDRRMGIRSLFFAYDLFDDYKYKHGDQNEVIEMMLLNGLHNYCHIMRGDAFKVYEEHASDSIDFLHFDISNTGETLIRMLETWGPKISPNGIIAFEGGSTERDNGWIKKYKKKPILHELVNNPFVYKNWRVQVFTPYPSLTLLFRKGEDVKKY